MSTGAAGDVTGGVLPQPESIRRRAVRGSMWTLGTFAYGNVARLAANVVLAYLLQANMSALGVMALVNILNRGLAMFSDIGLNLSVVQHKRGDDPAFLHTAWTLQVIRGVAIWLACLALAWPWAWFYGEPLLAVLIPIVGLVPLLGGFAGPGFLLAERHMHVGRTSAIQVLTQTVTLGTMLVWAYVSPTVWALAGGTVAGGVARVVVTYTVTRAERPRFHLEREAAVSMIRFGAWIFVSTAFTFFATELPTLSFGKVFGTRELAVFNVALMLATFPSLAVLRLARQVVFPALSAVVNKGGDLGHALDRVQRPVRVIAGLATSVGYASGPALVAAVYPPAFGGAGWMLRLLSISVLFLILGETSKSALLASGRASSAAFGQWVKVVGLVVLLPLGTWLGGVVGFVAAAAVAEFLRYLPFALKAEGRGLPVLVGDLRFVALTAAGCMLGMLAANGSAELLAETGLADRVQALGSCASGAIGASVVFVVPGLRALRTVRGRVA